MLNVRPGAELQRSPGSLGDGPGGSASQAEAAGGKGGGPGRSSPKAAVT